MNWHKLFEDEREHFRAEARELLEDGQFEGFELEDLAMHLYENQ
jgi:hypothetical protein